MIKPNKIRKMVVINNPLSGIDWLSPFMVASFTAGFVERKSEPGGFLF
jgi:hypothetical protein